MQLLSRIVPKKFEGRHVVLVGLSFDCFLTIFLLAKLILHQGRRAVGSRRNDGEYETASARETQFEAN